VGLAACWDGKSDLFLFIFKVVLEAKEQAIWIWVTSKGESYTCKDTCDSFRSKKSLIGGLAGVT
jgi:hypothetical protein